MTLLPKFSGLPSQLHLPSSHGPGVTARFQQWIIHFLALLRHCHLLLPALALNGAAEGPGEADQVLPGRCFGGDPGTGGENPAIPAGGGGFGRSTVPGQTAAAGTGLVSFFKFY
jgi:hypothetical protein